MSLILSSGLALLVLSFSLIGESLTLRVPLNSLRTLGDRFQRLAIILAGIAAFFLVVSLGIWFRLHADTTVWAALAVTMAILAITFGIRAANLRGQKASTPSLGDTLKFWGRLALALGVILVFAGIAMQYIPAF